MRSSEFAVSKTRQDDWHVEANEAFRRIDLESADKSASRRKRDVNSSEMFTLPCPKTRTESRDWKARARSAATRKIATTGISSPSYSPLPLPLPLPPPRRAGSSLVANIAGNFYCAATISDVTANYITCAQRCSAVVRVAAWIECV